MSAPSLFRSSPARYRLAGRPSAATPFLSGAALVGEWQLAELSGATAIDSRGLSNGAYAGAIEFGLGSIVAGDGTTSVSFNGVDARLTIPHVAGMALASYSVVLYFQPRALPAAGLAGTLLTKYGATEPGAATIELYNDGGTGRVRAYTKTAAGSTVWLGGSSSGFGTIAVDTAYRVALVVDADGARFYLDNTEVATSTNAEGWINNDVDLHVGHRNAVARYNGLMKRVLLYDGALTVGQIAALAAAQNASEGGASDITLEAIDAWAVDADSGGTISSATGGNMPVITVDVDPTSYVNDATGTKADWVAEFRNASLGSWTRLASGDFRYTPGATAGTDDAEYRVSDDAGATWSDWTPITIEVVARPPGPFFLLEDYAGDNQDRIQAAIDDANAAGGTVTTLARTALHDNVTELNPREAHFLGVMLKRRRSIHGPTGDFAGENVGPTKCDDADWLAGGSPGYFGRILNQSAGAATKEMQYVLCEFDGNALQQALRHTQGDQPIPASPCGTAWPGDTSSADFFNLQQQSIINFRGASATGTENMRRGFFKRCRFRNTPGDGILIGGSAWVRTHDCEFTDCARGSVAIGSGNSIAENERITCLSPTLGGGIDYEAFLWVNTLQVQSVNTECAINEDFDCQFRHGSDHTFTSCTVGPGLLWLGGGGGICSHIDGEVRFHVRGGGTGGAFPREAIWGADDDIMTLSFDGTRFVAWGEPHYYHAQLFTPAIGDVFEIEIATFNQPGQSLTLSFTNVTLTSHNLPGNNTVRLIRTQSAFTTAQSTVRLDGVTIGPEYALDAFRLNGQRLEFRNVVHQGFPSATIQEICPGAGQYVAIDGGGASEPPPDPGELGSVTPIAEDNHPNLMWTDAEIIELRNLINAGTFPDLNAAWNRIANTTAILIPPGWPTTYPETARHARPANHNNLLACISYAVEPTTAKANAIRNALNDMKNRYPNGRRGDLNYGSWHHSWAWMFDLIQAYHPGHFTAQERAEMKEWYRRCAAAGNSIRNLAVRSNLLNNSEYNSSNYDRTDAGKRVTFYTNWYARNLCPTGAMALVSGNQTQVDFYFQSWHPDHADVLHKGQITASFPPDGLNRFDLPMYVLSMHPHGENTDTWGREHFRHPEDDFFTQTYGRYHPSTSSNVFMAAEMAYRNGMTGIFHLEDSFVSSPYLLLTHEFMYDFRNALNRSGGGSFGIPAFGFYWAGLAWARYDTAKINDHKTFILNQTDQRGDGGGDAPDDFFIIYKYPRRVV